MSLGPVECRGGAARLGGSVKRISCHSRIVGIGLAVVMLGGCTMLGGEAGEGTLAERFKRRHESPEARRFGAQLSEKLKAAVVAQSSAKPPITCPPKSSCLVSTARAAIARCSPPRLP